MRERRTAVLLALVLCGAAALSGCGAGTGGDGTKSPAESGTEETSEGISSAGEDASGEPEMTEYSFFAMDTYMDLKVLDEPDGTAVYDLEDEINRVEDLMSVTIDGSDLYEINHAEGATVTVSAEVASLLSESLDYCRDTGGALNIAIYPLSVAWGFSSASEEGFRVVPEEEREELLPLCDWTQVVIDGTEVTIPDGFGLDLGGIAKGYALDRCVSLLTERGIGTALLYLGGDVYALGTKENGDPWRVAIQDPDDTSGGSYVGVLEAADIGIVTSGTYERYFEEDGVRYHHILDSDTGAPAESGLTSVTIVCQDGTRSDAMATALLDMGLEAGIEFWRDSEGFDVIWVTEEDDLYITEGLGDIFTASDGWDARVVER